MATTPQYNFNVNRQDLDFILQQIKYAEVSTLPNGQIDGNALRNAIAGVGAQPSAAALLPYGLRTVDGTWNNLLPGQERSGAADNLMPRLVPINLQAAQPGDPDGPGPAPVGPSSYAQNSGAVFDAQPRIVSNLIVDQTANNPAAVQADLERAGVLGDAAPVPVIRADGSIGGASLVIPNLSPDIGLSPPFNSWMTFFGQFFDHGLDLIDKGQSGTVFVPLQPDDPLFVVGSPTNFMVLTRATNQPGPDGVIGTADDIHDHRNTTTPFVDQNQTYTSHPSHQVFLREYVDVNPAAAVTTPMSTGNLLQHKVISGLVTTVTGEGNWADVKAQAATLLGIRLVDTDVLDCPLLATDRYGEFIRGPNGFPQIVTATGLVEGNPAGGGVLLPANTIRTGHAFLVDIAHNAVPGTVFDTDGLPATPGTTVVGPDADTATGNTIATDFQGRKVAYDDELLNTHFITGDGRGNENIGLTAVHTVFHSEHNRLVEEYKHTIVSGGSVTFANEWLRTPLAGANLTAFNAIPAAPGAARDLAIDNLVRALSGDSGGVNTWDGERLFQAGRFVTEMQYQHLVFEEFARGVSPTIDPFIFSNSSDLNPAIFAEFANVVYRFGHSMLTETVGRLAADGQTPSDIGLIQAFLNPLEFNNNNTLSEAQAVGQIVRGNTRIVGNEIDEFIVEALRNNLVGLPLDLSVLNMTRARETGMPSFNEARAQFYAMTGDAQLAPFTSWADMAGHLKHSGSIINFIAAYGLHPSITAETTLVGKRDAATAMVMGVPVGAHLVPADRVAFLNSTGTWNPGNSGLNKVDFWIGGLAEFVNEFQGMLGPTFNFVFEKQLENLQNGDRFYYLSRTQGTNMLHQLENNTFSKLIMRNSDLGSDSTHLPSLVFTTPNWTLEVNQARQNNPNVMAGPDGILVDDPLTVVNEAADNRLITADPTGDDPILEAINPMVQRDVATNYISFAGGEHVTLGGSPGNDILRGGKGIDSLWGDAGNDRLDGGDEADQVHGGDGDDIITDHGTPAGGIDFLHGDNGDDVISGGTGNDLLFGGPGNDFIILGNDFTEVFAGEGNDFILGGNGPDTLLGNEGNDWIEGGEGFDGISGENSELFFNSPIIGHDVLNGQGNDTDYDGESGDDIMVEGPGIQRNNGMLGFDWAIHKGDPLAADSDLGIAFFPAQTVFTLRDRFDSVEGLSGWNFNDRLTGVSFPTGAVGAAGGIFGAPGSDPQLLINDSKLLSQNVSLVSGLAALLGTTPAAVNALPVNSVVFDPSAGGDILIGGGGSDFIFGKAGNDVIDGNAWMNVRISFLKTAFTSLTPAPFATDPTDSTRYTVDSINALKSYMLAGNLSPGALTIVREILTAAPVTGENDVALFAGTGGVFSTPGGVVSNLLDAAAGSVLTGVVAGVPSFSITRNANGTVTVVDLDIATVPTGPDGLPVADKLLVNEGTDTLRGIETLRFTNADGVTFTEVRLSLVNAAPVGTFNVSDTTPTQGPLLGATPALVASTTGITDANNITLANPTGAVAAAAMSFQWQASPDGGTTWVSVPANGGSATASYTPRDGATEAIVGQPLRVQVSYTDALGVLENVFSAPTDVLGNFNNLIVGSGGGVLAQANATAGADNLAGSIVLSGNNIIDGLAGDDIIDGRDGQDTLIGGLGNDFITGGTGRDTMTGGAGADIFDFNAAAESPVGGGAHDIITDFLTGTDRIDVSTIDANAGVLGNQAFTPLLVVGGAFTANGQVRVTQQGTSTLVEFNTTGGAGSAPEFEIELLNVVANTLSFTTDLIP